MQSKSERSRQQKHRDWLLLGDANRQRIREIEKRLADPHPDSNLTRICYFRSDRISDEWASLDVHHEPTAEEVSDFDGKLITRLDYIERVTVLLTIDNGSFIDMDTPMGRFTLGLDTYGRRACFAILSQLLDSGLITLKADATVQLPEGWKR